MLVLAVVAIAMLVPRGGLDPAASADPGHGEEHQPPSDGAAPTTDPVDDLATFAAEFGNDWWRSSDFVIKAEMDEEGYHLYKALEREAFGWRPLASIRPGGSTEWDWTGYHCVSPSGRYVGVVVAPAIAANRAQMRDRGALAYVVDVDSGDVEPVVAGVSLKYHTPGCGIDDRVAFSRNLGDDQEQTEILTVDMANAQIERSDLVDEQLTSAIPTPNGPVAVAATSVVRVGQSDTQLDVMATFPQAPFSLRPGADGEVELLTMGDWGASDAASGAAVDTQRATAWTLREDGGTAVIGSGPASKLSLFATADGTALVGADSVVDSEATTVIESTPGAGAPKELSHEGNLLISHAPPRDPSAGASPGGNTPVPDDIMEATATSELLEREVGEPGAAEEALPTEGMSARGGGMTTSAVGPPACSVGRNDPALQAYQATHDEIDWAVKRASEGTLAPVSGEFSGPNYAPFPDLKVPAVLMNAVLAQESAYMHASRRALPGLGGNPSIADYYGTRGETIDVIDYAQADCGYGVAQVTTGMRASETNVVYDLAQQKRIATDYQTNIAAGMKILRTKFIDTHAAGLRANSGNPGSIENWYFALWAYNTGFYPNTGSGPWGVGWTNNPQNNDYAPNRDLFLRASYADAEHPASWPYQERVLGWTETPIFNYKGVASYLPVNSQLDVPAYSLFCTADNNCDPTEQPSNLAFCKYRDPLDANYRKCWWNDAVTWAQCPQYCQSDVSLYTGSSPKPAPVNPYPPACDVDAAQLPAGDGGAAPIIVDEIPTNTNVVGCSTTTKNWASSGTFVLTEGQHNGEQVGRIDTHQLGSGFGGRTLFLGNRTSNETAISTGTWTPNLSATPRGYTISVHIPESGASVTDATYVVNDGAGGSKTVVIDQHLHEDRWVPLTSMALRSGANVKLTNTSAMAAHKYTVAFDAVAFTPVAGTPHTHTFDAMMSIDPNQNFDTAAAMHPGAGAARSMSAMHAMGVDMSADLTNAANRCTVKPAPCIGNSTYFVSTVLKNRVAAAGTGVRPNYQIGDETIGKWMGLSNERPPADITDQLRNDLHAYKVHTKLTIDFLSRPDGTIEPASLIVHQLDTTAGDASMPDFLLHQMQAYETDYGVDRPDLTYQAADLNTYTHEFTEVDPLVRGSVPGRAYMHNIESRIRSGGDCARVRSISGGAAGYKPMILDAAVRGAAAAWLSDIQNEVLNNRVPARVGSNAQAIYDLQFKPGNSLDPINGLRSPWWFAPAIWMQTDFAVCTSGDIFRPTGVNGQLAFNSYMANLYLWEDSTQLVGLQGQPLTEVAANEARPAQTGNVFNISQPPESYTAWLAIPLATDDAGNGDTYNPWDECILAPAIAPNDPPKWRRRGSPWKLSFYENVDQTPHEVRFCDWPSGVFKGDPNSVIPPPAK